MAVSRKIPVASPVIAPEMSLDQQLCFALYSASLAMTRVYRPLLARLGLTYPQYVVMLALWEYDGLSIGELGERVALDSGTLTPLLKRMQALGLIERTRSAADERLVLVTLTRAGRELGSKAEEVGAEVACAVACSARERQALTQTLQSLRGSLLSHAASRD